MLLELFRIGEQASDLHASDEWGRVLAEFSEQARAEALEGLKATRTVVDAMIRDLDDPNYGRQR